MALPRRWRALDTLRLHGVQLLTGAVVEAITADGVVYSQHGEEHVAPADHVILATGVDENRSLADALATCGADIHLLGDFGAPGTSKGPCSRRRRPRAHCESIQRIELKSAL